MILQVMLKLRPAQWQNMYSILADAARTVQASYTQGGIAVDVSVLAAAEYCTRISANQYHMWNTKKPDKTYNYRLPISVAIALCRMIQNIPQYSFGQVALHEHMIIRLHDSGVDIQHYFKK